MRGGRARTVAVGLLAAGLLVACGDDDGDEGSSGDTEAPSSEASGGGSGGDAGARGGVYEGELADGSRLVIHLDVPADHPAVVPFEEFRARTGAPEPTWIVGEVTPPDDADGTGRFVTFLEAGADRLDDDLADKTDGVTNAEFACAFMEEWFQAAPVKDQALGDAYTEVYEGPCGSQTYQVLAPAGTTTTYVMVYEGPLPDFETIEAELGNELSPA